MAAKATGAQAQRDTTRRGRGARKDVAVPLPSLTIDAMATLRIKIAAVLVALCATVALGACGNETDTDQASDSTSESTGETPSESPTETSTEPLPECADVWVDGQDLPKDYKACTTDGETIKPVRHTCGYGATFFEHDGRFFALKGNRITDAGDLETSDEYQQLLTTCQA